MKNSSFFDYFTISIIAIVASVIMLFLSPLNYLIHIDSGIFLQVAKQVVHGDTMYVDIFDHKGPILFWLNALPQYFIEGTFGVFLLEILFLIGILWLIYKISIEATNNDKFLSYAFVFTYLFIGIYTYEGGNNSESYANLFNFIALLFLLRPFFNNTVADNKSYFIAGAMFALITFIRINNAAPFLPICASLVLFLFLQKEIKIIINLIIAFIAGFIIVTAPIIIYFLINGTLYEFLYATFLFNFKYAGKMSLLEGFITILTSKFIVYKSFVILNLLLGFIITVMAIMYKDWQKMFYGILSAIIMTVTLCASGTTYLHYITIFLPQLIIYCLIINHYLNLPSWFSKLACAGSFVLFVLACYKSYQFNHGMATEYEQYKKDSIEFVEIAGQDQEIFTYGLFASWHYINDRKALTRFFTLQDFWAEFDIAVEKEVYEFVTQTQPLWIAVSERIDPDADNIEVARMNQLIKEQYELVKSNSIGRLYKRKE